MNPTVSVILPSYNHEKYLKDRIESILNQTFQNFEIIILDDVSPDNSRQIIEQYRAHSKVKHIIFNDINSGSTFFQWNKGIDLAKGEYIWIAESDDVAEPDFLMTLVSKLKEHPRVGIAFCQSTRMNSEGEIKGTWRSQTQAFKKSENFDNSFIMNGKEFIKNYLILINVIPNASAVVFRKNLYKKVNGASIKLKMNGDWELWFKMLAVSDIYYHSKPLNHFRFHSSSVIARANNENISRNKQRIKIVTYDVAMRLIIKDFLQSQITKLSSIDKYILNKNNQILQKQKIKLLVSKIFSFFEG